MVQPTIRAEASPQTNQQPGVCAADLHGHDSSSSFSLSSSCGLLVAKSSKSGEHLVGRVVVERDERLPLFTESDRAASARPSSCPSAAAALRLGVGTEVAAARPRRRARPAAESNGRGANRRTAADAARSRPGRGPWRAAGPRRTAGPAIFARARFADRQRPAVEHLAVETSESPARRARGRGTRRTRSRAAGRFRDRPAARPATAARRCRSTCAGRLQSCCRTDYRRTDGQPIKSPLEGPIPTPAIRGRGTPERSQLYGEHTRNHEPGRKAREMAGAHTLAADPVEKPYSKSRTWQAGAIVSPKEDP